MDRFDANILEIHHLREQNIQLQKQNEQLEKQVQLLQQKAEVQENTITLLKNKLKIARSNATNFRPCSAPQLSVITR